ncbi:MAG: polyprenol monophosphomannose synthase [Anaerolineae bacterium]|nr:polyprenol monophosphomannose synthase [Anaerolineae bacterium]MCI0609721.1 polyprenol monophosphomannose synthase [Anaerolineae bacterium]
MRIVVVLPTYNEAENLKNLVSVLFSLPLDLMVLVVDDNSPDGTGNIAEKLSTEHQNRVAVLHRAGKQGLRSAYIEGFHKAFEMGADAVVQMDADLSHDPVVLTEMSNRLASCDVVIGSRYVKGGSLDERWPLWRKALSAFGNNYARTILGFPLHDVTTGYRMWKCEALYKIPLDRIRSNGYIFLVEMAYVAFLMEYDITEVPIHFADRRWGKSKMSLKIQLEAAIRIWDVWWHYRDLRKRSHPHEIKVEE